MSTVYRGATLAALCILAWCTPFAAGATNRHEPLPAASYAESYCELASAQVSMVQRLHSSLPRITPAVRASLSRLRGITCRTVTPVQRTSKSIARLPLNHMNTISLSSRSSFSSMECNRLAIGYIRVLASVCQQQCRRSQGSTIRVHIQAGVMWL